MKDFIDNTVRYGTISLLFVFLLTAVSSAQPPADHTPTDAPTTPTSTPQPTVAPTPQVTPTPQPTSTKERPYDVTFRFDYQPPLSVTDSIRLLYRVRNLLDPDDPDFLEVRREKATEVIDLIIDYVKMTDDRHSLLPFYEWRPIGEKRVSLGGIDEDTYDVSPVHRDISALSFVARRGDVYIHNITVIDEEDKETKFKVERWIRIGVPRKEVCFLYFPTNIDSIVINYSSRKNARENPHLQVFIGKTNVPEYGKAALYYLSRARRMLAGDRDFEEIIKEIKHAIESLVSFKNSRLLS